MRDTMSYSELQREVEIVLEAALFLSEDGVSIPALAQRIYDAEPELVAKVQRAWTVERFTWMLHRVKQRVRPDNQLMLPGFEKLPRRLILKGGKYAKLRFATVIQLRQYRSLLWKKRDPRIETFDKLIGLVSAYARRRPEITVQEVMEAEMKRLESGAE